MFIFRLVRERRPKHRKGKSTGARESETVKEKGSVSRKPKQKAKLDEYYVSVDSEEQSSGMSERYQKLSLKHYTSNLIHYMHI